MALRMTLLAPVLGIFLAAACSAAPPSPPSAAPPPGPSVPSPPPAPEDPRSVRCGIDDRPRSVVSASDDPGDFSRAKVIISKPRADPFIPPNAGFAPPPLASRMVPPSQLMDMAPEPRGMPIPMPTRPGPPPPPPEEWHITRLPATMMAGEPMPSSLAASLSAGNPQYEICEPLAATPDEGRFDFDLELASNGTPLRVSPTGPGQPDRLARCLMERTCQLRGAPDLGRSAHVRVPIAVQRSQPPPPPPPPPPTVVPGVPVDVLLEKAAPGFDELHQRLRAQLGQAAGQCGMRFRVSDRSQARFILQLEPGGGVASRRRPASPFFRVGEIRTQSISAVTTELLGCIVEQLNGAVFPGRAGAQRRSESLLVTWSP